LTGGAALLMQAGATDIRLLKALLLNGADKPADWTNAPAAPLDQRYGAGIMNVTNSLRQFRQSSRGGWDIATIGSNEVRQYAFESRGAATTATLVWLRNYRCTNINNLDLAIRSEAGELVAISRSALDNLEHLHLRNLPVGRYTLEVSAGDGSDTYALAFDFGPSAPPRLAPWTLSGDPNQGYVIESTVDLRTWTPWATITTSAAGTAHFSPGVEGLARFFRAVEIP
jgi:hypothetical protein